MRRECGRTTTRCRACAPGRWPSSPTTMRRHPLGHAIVLLSVLLAVGASVSTQYGMKHLIDVISGGPAAAGTRVWWAFALLAAWSPPTTCCGASPAMPPRAPSSRSPATSARDLFALPVRPFARLLRRASAGRPGQPHHRHRQRCLHAGEYRLPGTCCRRSSRWCCAIVLIGSVNPTLAGGADRLRRGAGRVDLLPGPARHAAASRLCQQGRRGGRRAGGRDRQFQRGARVRRDAARAAPDRRDDRGRDGRAARAACSISRTCG